MKFNNFSAEGAKQATEAMKQKNVKLSKGLESWALIESVAKSTFDTSNGARNEVEVLSVEVVTREGKNAYLKGKFRNSLNGRQFVSTVPGFPLSKNITLTSQGFEQREVNGVMRNSFSYTLDGNFDMLDEVREPNVNAEQKSEKAVA